MNQIIFRGNFGGTAACHPPGPFGRITVTYSPETISVQYRRSKKLKTAIYVSLNLEPWTKPTLFPKFSTVKWNYVFVEASAEATHGGTTGTAANEGKLDGNGRTEALLLLCLLTITLGILWLPLELFLVASAYLNVDHLKYLKILTLFSSLQYITDPLLFALALKDLRRTLRCF